MTEPATTDADSTSLSPQLETATAPPIALPASIAEASKDSADFFPHAVATLRAAGLGPHLVESLALKSIYHCGASRGRDIATQLALPFAVVEPLLFEMKLAQLVVLKAGAPAGDYVYELTERGRAQASQESSHSSYCGAAPVELADYTASVQRQSVKKQKPRLADVRRALADLVLSDEQCCSIGEAMNSGIGFFLSGAAGNGKTSVAERVTSVYGRGLWIPRAILAGGEIIRLFDPSCHEELPFDLETAGFEPHQLDRRWVYILRPTIIAGGEMTLDQLEPRFNVATGVLEAPLTLKANGGTLVIDDFGRQKFRPEELFNRLVLPMERQIDNLSLPSGRTFQVPFDQLTVFSTNFDPVQLVEEAFLRRIPYKIDIGNPTEEQFREVFGRVAKALGIICDRTQIDYLLETAFTSAGRPMRFCHPRDLLLQVYNFCTFRELPLLLTREAIDAAVRNYFVEAPNDR